MIKVKICGIQTLDAAVEADKNGADFIGFIFYRKSPRYIDPFKAAEIAKSVSCKKVGVFVDEEPLTVNGISRLVNLDYIQLHGNEDAKYISKIHRTPIIKAFPYKEDFDVREVNKFPCEIVLLDSFVKGRMGGTGKTFDWHKASTEIRKLTKPVLIAGGISTQNILEVIDIFHPFGVDLSGSLEINGVKSVNKIREFLQRVKGNQELQQQIQNQNQNIRNVLEEFLS